MSQTLPTLQCSVSTCIAEQYGPCEKPRCKCNSSYCFGHLKQHNAELLEVVEKRAPEQHSMPQLINIVDGSSLPTPVQTVGVSTGKLAAEKQDRRDVHVHDLSTAYLVYFGMPNVFFTFAPDDVHQVLGIRLCFVSLNNTSFPADGSSLLTALNTTHFSLTTDHCIPPISLSPQVTVYHPSLPYHRSPGAQAVWAGHRIAGIPACGQSNCRYWYW